MPTLKETKDAWYDSLDMHMKAIEAMGSEPISRNTDFATTFSATHAAASAVLIAQGDRQIELLEGILAGVKKLW